MPRFPTLLAFALFSFGVARAATTGFTLEMELAADRPVTLQLFYDNGQFWSDHDSLRVAIPASAELLPLRLNLPAEPIKRLRLDPSDGESVLRIAHLRLRTNEGELVREISPTALRPIWQVQPISITGDVATIRTAPHADDPKLLIAERLHAETVRRLDRHLASRTGILLLAAIAALAAGFAGWIVCRTLFTPVSGVSRRLVAGVFFAVLLVVAGERLWWLRDYANAVPFWDEWASDWLYLLMPLQGGFLDWSAIFIPQSEHRIVATRLLTLVTAITSGEWDPRIGMTASALLWGTGVGLVAAMLMRAGKWIGLTAAVTLAVIAAQPFDVVNIFWGGQSQMFALVLGMVACLALAVSPAPGATTVVAAALAGTLSLGTMGSGLLAPGLAAAICAARALTEREHRRNLWLIAAISLALAIAGLAWRNEARLVGPQYASSVGQFWTALTGFGAWPLPAGAGWWLVRNLPWLLQCALVAWRRRGSPLEWFAIGLGAWAVLGDCGLAYARPWMSPPTDTRHFSPLFVGTIAAIANAASLAAHAVARWRPVSILAGLAALATAAAMIPACVSGINGAKSQSYWGAAHEAVVYPFLAKGDFAATQDLPADGKSPYWNSTDLAVLLDDPLIWPMLPSQLRKRVALRPESPFPPASVHAGWVTLSARTLMKLGPWLAGLGLALFALLAWREPGSTRPQDPAP